ncbi:hypothetical protein MIMGU_mgv11b022727mg, partial [Erythranthe guttata]
TAWERPERPFRNGNGALRFGIRNQNGICTGIHRNAEKSGGIAEALERQRVKKKNINKFIKKKIEVFDHQLFSPRMGPKTDIGWDFGDMVGENRKKINVNSVKLKQHIAHISGEVEVEACKKAPKEISLMLRKHLQESKTTRELMKKTKETAIMSIREECRHIHDVDTESSSENDDEQGSRYANKEYLSQMEKKQLRNATRESRKQAFDEEERMRYNDGI